MACQALKWWKEGRILEHRRVLLLRREDYKELHEYGRDHGRGFFYIDRLGQKR